MAGVTRRDALYRLLILPLGGISAGCALLDASRGSQTATARKLPPIALSPQAVQLDVTYIERPHGDPRMGEELWRQVDELGGVEPETRALLRQHGFRVGVTAANPPLALQQMLGAEPDFAYEPDAEQAKQSRGHRYVILSGGHAEIRTSPNFPSCTIDLPGGNGARTQTLHEVCCYYRLSPRKLQDGWVRLEFVPQIHYGQMRDNIVAEGPDLRYQRGQQTHTFYPQRFHLTLGTGEIALVTGEQNSEGTLGSLFFRGPAALQVPRDEMQPQDVDAPALSDPIQRMLVVRLAGLQSSLPHGA